MQLSLLPYIFWPVTVVSYFIHHVIPFLSAEFYMESSINYLDCLEANNEITAILRFIIFSVDILYQKRMNEHINEQIYVNIYNYLQKKTNRFCYCVEMWFQ